MKLGLSIAGLLFAFSAFANPPGLKVPQGDFDKVAPATRSHDEGEVNCVEGVGRRLCSNLRSFRNLLVDCYGYACYTLWSDQLSSIDRFLVTYQKGVGVYDAIAEDLGQQAHNTARKLCPVEITGDPTWVQTLAIKYNRLLDALTEIQDVAGVPVKTCRFTVQ